MTVSTSRATEMTVDQIVRRAWQMAGLMPVEEGTSGPSWAERSDFGRTMLDVILDGLQTEGAYARQVVLENTTLTAADYTYTMSDYVLDIVGDGMYIDASETDLTKAAGETLVRQISREQWHELGAKDSSGRPSQFFFDRSLLEVKLWPIPDEAGTIRFQIHKFTTDSLEGGATLELRPYWYRYLIWELAHYIATAQGLSDQRCSRYEKRAKEYKNRARAYANQNVNIQMRVAHDTPWRT
jgi:hypothetical protein